MSIYVDYFSTNIEKAIDNERLKEAKTFLENSVLSQNANKKLDLDEINNDKFEIEYNIVSKQVKDLRAEVY